MFLALAEMWTSPIRTNWCRRRSPPTSCGRSARSKRQSWGSSSSARCSPASARNARGPTHMTWSTGCRS
eukprot:6432579-Prymnesium_polylepis.1